MKDKQWTLNYFAFLIQGPTFSGDNVRMLLARDSKAFGLHCAQILKVANRMGSEFTGNSARVFNACAWLVEIQGQRNRQPQVLR